MRLFIVGALLLLTCACLPAQTLEDYGRSMVEIFDAGISLAQTPEAVEERLPNIKKISEDANRLEYELAGNPEMGHVKTSFYFATKSEAQLYQIAFVFNNPDSTLELARQAFKDSAKHPSLDDHWVIAVSAEDHSIVVLIWVYENMLIMAGNMAGSELEYDIAFQLSEEFITAFLGEDATQTSGGGVALDTVPVPSGDHKVVCLNTYILNAQNNFEDFKGSAVPDRKDVYYALLQFGDEGQTTIRRRGSNNWRLESKLASASSLKEANALFEEKKAYFETLQGLDYHLVHQSSYSTATGNAQVWNIQTSDGEPLGLTLKLQLAAYGSTQFDIQMEIGQKK
jgi:hypothetical protein